MQPKFKYGLTNASQLLKQLRHEKYTQFHNQNQNIHEKTFVDQEFSISRNTLIQKNKQASLEINQKIYQQQPVSLSQIIIKQHLKSTLELYRSDLNQLEENSQNLIDGIQQLSQKISALPDLHTKNQNLQLQNFKLRKDIECSIKQYHKTKIQLQQRKLKLNHKFMQKKQKIKKILQLVETETQERVCVESWENYFYQLLKNRYMANKDMGNISPQIGAKSLSIVLGRQKQQNKIPKEKSITKDRDGILGDLKSFAKNFKMP